MVKTIVSGEDVSVAPILWQKSAYFHAFPPSRSVFSGKIFTGNYWFSHVLDGNYNCKPKKRLGGFGWLQYMIYVIVPHLVVSKYQHYTYIYIYIHYPTYSICSTWDIWEMFCISEAHNGDWLSHVIQLICWLYAIHSGLSKITQQTNHHFSREGKSWSNQKSDENIILGVNDDPLIVDYPANTHHFCLTPIHWKNVGRIWMIGISSSICYIPSIIIQSYPANKSS